MNESDLKNQLQEFAEPIRFSPRKPVRTRPWRTLTVGTATLLVAGGVFLLTPRVTPASEVIQHMESALENVKTMEADQFLVARDGSASLAMSFRYRAGAWTLRSRLTSPLERTYILRDGFSYVYIRRHNVLTREPYRNWMPAYGSALEFAKEQTNYGLAEPRQMRLEELGETYKLIFDRPTDEYHSEIVVDRKTNLPISSDTWVRYEPNEPKQHMRMTYQFNTAIPEQTFDPGQFGVKCVDLLKESANFVRRYRKPVATFGDVQVHEASISTDGTVFLLTSTKGRSRDPITEVRTPSGTPFLRLESTEPGGTWGDTAIREYLTFDDRQFRLTLWQSLKPSTHADVRELRIAGASIPPPLEESRRFTADAEVTVPLVRLKTDRPAWSTVFSIDQVVDHSRISAARVRGDWYRDHDQPEAELPWRWKQYHEGYNFTPGFGRIQVQDLANCLRSLGRMEEASRVMRELGPKKRED